ncbi:MAG: hypothetical protein FWF10_03235 [Clostridiales bacterium]|nr:hypothetical protein [Clostridiales bacterium]
MPKPENRRITKTILIILTILLLCGLAGGFAFCFLHAEEFLLFGPNDRVTRVVIGDSHSHEYYVVDNARDCKALQRCFMWVSEHMGDRAEDQPRIWFLDEYGLLANIAYPSEYEPRALRIAGAFRKEEYKKYIYTFYVKSRTDYYSLQAQLRGDGYNAYLPTDDILETKPGIELEYIFDAENKRDYEQAFWSEGPIGKYKPDDYFIPFVEELKALGAYFGSSDCSFSRSSNYICGREITLYLDRSLTEEEILALREKAEREYNPRALPISASPFLYFELEEYEIKVIFEEARSPAQLAAFCAAYGVDNFDYDKEAIDYDALVIYYKEPKEDFFRAIRLSAGEPQIDSLPNGIGAPVFEDITLSDAQMREVQRLVSNYNLLQIPDNLGFASYEFDKYVYLDISIDGAHYICGGQSPFSYNARFKAMCQQIFHLLGIHFYVG